jgi:hypothetical protein
MRDRSVSSRINLLGCEPDADIGPRERVVVAQVDGIRNQSDICPGGAAEFESHHGIGPVTDHPGGKSIPRGRSAHS